METSNGGSVLAATCDQMSPLVTTLTFLVEQAGTAELDLQTDRPTLLLLQAKLQKLGSTIETTLAKQPDQESFGLRLRDNIQLDSEPAPSLEEMYRPQMHSEALEIVSAWHAAGRDSSLASDLFGVPAVDRMTGERRTPQQQEPQPAPQVSRTTTPTPPSPATELPTVRDAALPADPDALLTELVRSKGDKHSMHGTSSSLAIDTVFQVLARSKRTGRLEIQTCEETQTFALIDGQLAFTAAQGSHPEERLGELLVRLGHLTREQLEEVLKEQLTERAHARGADPTIRIGGRLQNRFGLSKEAIAAALTMQAKQRFQRAQEATSAAFAFYPGPQFGGDALRLTVLEFLLDSARELDERSDIAQSVGS